MSTEKEDGEVVEDRTRYIPPPKKEKKLTILHPPTIHPARLILQLNPHPSRIRPVLWMHLPRLQHHIVAQSLHRIRNLPRQRIFHRKRLADSSALGSAPRRVEVDGVERLPVTVVFFFCGGDGGRGRVGDGGLGTAGFGGGGGGGGGGADDGCGIEVGGVEFGGVGIGVGVGDFFDAGVVGHLYGGDMGIFCVGSFMGAVYGE